MTAVVLVPSCHLAAARRIADGYCQHHLSSEGVEACMRRTRVQFTANLRQPETVLHARGALSLPAGAPKYPCRWVRGGPPFLQTFYLLLVHSHYSGLQAGLGVRSQSSATPCLHGPPRGVAACAARFR